MENSCYILRKKESDANKNSQIFAIFIMCSMTLSIINWIFYAIVRVSPFRSRAIQPLIQKRLFSHLMWAQSNTHA